MNSTLASPRPFVGHGRRLLECARRHLAEGRPLQAAKDYAGVLEEDPVCVEAHGQLGSLFFQFKRYTESHACLQKAV